MTFVELILAGRLYMTRRLIINRIPETLFQLEDFWS